MHRGEQGGVQKIYRKGARGIGVATGDVERAIQRGLEGSEDRQLERIYARAAPADGGERTRSQISDDRSEIPFQPASMSGDDPRSPFHNDAVHQCDRPIFIDGGRRRGRECLARCH